MILQEPNYNFPVLNFSCDNVFANHIKEPFPNKSFFMVLCGRPGSGKTSLLLNLLNERNQNRVYYQTFHKILYCCPLNSRASVTNNPFEDLPENQKFESFSPDILQKIKEIRKEFLNNEIEKKKKKLKYKNENQLLIIDDCTSELKDKKNLKSFIEMTTNRRHLRLSIILLVQFLRAIPKPIRFQVTDVVLFKTSNRMDSRIIQEEYINMNNEKFLELTNFCWENDHDFIFINKNNEQYYKNLQRIIFDNENENQKKNMEV
jgi:DNA replication protein DnaC